MKILLGLTTTPDSDWKRKIKDIDKLKLEEVSLFLTGLDKKKRKDLYGLLEKSPIRMIPHVHLRDDMESWEADYLVERYGVQVFNIHNKRDVHPFDDFQDIFGKYSPITYIENTENVPDEEELREFGGLCVDFSHWEDGVLFNWDSYGNRVMEKRIRDFPIGCSHISAVGREIWKNYDLGKPEVLYKNYSKHIFGSLSEFDYMKKYLDYLPELVILELENSFEEQLEVKKYLEKMIHER